MTHSSPEAESERRAKAWMTRRAKYGPAGHAGAYLRSGALARRALDLIIRLHREGVLSEGQCCKALDMDRGSFRALCDRSPHQSQEALK